MARQYEVASLMLGDEGTKAADYANYFVSYSYLYHQKQMLTDEKRMRAYRDAMVGNGALFAGATVLDVGAGSGILSLWAAKAGARKVIACEFTSMADHARTLVRENGYSEVVEVRQCAVESLELEKGTVDIIISEWMGYFLLRESMLDSVLYARDTFLKPNGTILPNRARLYWAPANLRDERDARLKDRADAMADFDAFAHDLRSSDGLDFFCLRKAYAREQTDYYLRQAQWLECREDQLLAEPALVRTFDLYDVTREDARGVDDAPFDFPNVPFTAVSAFLGFFAVDFDTDGHGNDLPRCVELSTAPKDGYTHWGQQVFYTPAHTDYSAVGALTPPGNGDDEEEDNKGNKAQDFFPSSTTGSLSLVRQSNAVRLYDVKVDIIDNNKHQPGGNDIKTTTKKSLTWELS
mmetsp:Transcript_22850/g.73474  ORF Transcript_22850/g.73474 Transcript_22850/m.73474 type:complete len:408 (+) Transcript_22850:128-1351(+)